MNALKTLSNIREYQNAILLMMERVEYLRLSLYGRAIQYNSDRVQRSPADVMCERLADACDRDAHIKRRQKKLDRRKDQIRSYMKLLPPDFFQILDLYYLSVKPSGRLYSWADIAAITGRSEAYVSNVLRYRAIDRLNEILSRY